MKNILKLNKLLLTFFLLYHVDIQEGYCEDNAKFNFLGIIRENRESWRVQFFRLPERPKFKIFWVHYNSLPFWATRRSERTKKRLAQVFSCEFCEIPKNTSFTDHLRATASGLKSRWLGLFHVFKYCLFRVWDPTVSGATLIQDLVCLPRKTCWR